MLILFLITILSVSCNDQISTSQTPKTTKAQKDKNKETTLSYPNAPTNISRTILKASDENLWMASWQGMIKFDGTTFSNITQNVSDNRFFTVYEDSPGKFWFGTIGGGIFHYDGNSFKNYTKEQGLVDDRVTNIYKDHKGQIWFGTIGGISIYLDNTFKNITEKDGLPTVDVNDIIQDADDNYWIGTRGLAYSYDGVKFEEIKREDGSGFTNVRHLLYDRNGNIWLAGNDGLWCFDGKEFIQFSENFTGYIFEDQQGNIWTSSEANVNSWELLKYDHESILKKENTHTKIKTDEGMFFGIEEDDDGNIWVGSLRGVHRYDGEKMIFFN